MSAAARLAARYRQAGREKFAPGDRVRVKDTHGYKPFRGDKGTIDKYVPFGKFYVKLEENGRQLVSEEDLELASKKASSLDIFKEAVIRKEKGKGYCVKSPNNPDWNGGCYPSKGEAEERLEQVEYFKKNK